ncbi:MAG: hypothetical protein ABIM99_05620 [Candidatus Dojkabacteria bacterium]
MEEYNVEGDTQKIEKPYFPRISLENIASSNLSSLDCLEHFGIIYDGEDEMKYAEALFELVKMYIYSGIKNPIDKHVNIGFVIINDLFKRPIQDFRLKTSQRRTLANNAQAWMESFIPTIYSLVNDNTRLSEAQIIVLKKLGEIAFPGQAAYSLSSSANYGTRGGSRRSST